MAIGRDMMMTALLLSLPTLAVSLIVGLVISIFQAVTSIQEHTLTYAPRIIAVGFVVVLTMPWALKLAVQFTMRMLWYAADAAG